VFNDPHAKNAGNIGKQLHFGYRNNTLCMNVEYLKQGKRKTLISFGLFDADTSGILEANIWREKLAAVCCVE
jgi:hypothetical protein